MLFSSKRALRWFRSGCEPRLIILEKLRENRKVFAEPLAGLVRLSHRGGTVSIATLVLSDADGTEFWASPGRRGPGLAGAHCLGALPRPRCMRSRPGPRGSGWLTRLQASWAKATAPAFLPMEGSG